MPEYTDIPPAREQTPAEWRAAHVEDVTAAARPLDAAVEASYGPPRLSAMLADVGQPSGRVARFLAILDAQPVERVGQVALRAARSTS